MLTISNTEMMTFERCRRKWYVSYYLGFQPAEERAASNRNLGIRVHVAMEAWAGYQLDPAAVLDLLYQIELEAHPEETEELLKEQEMAQIMVAGYLEWALEQPEEADWLIVATEADVRTPLPNFEGEIELRSRMDQVAQRKSDGILAFRDWKTSANFERHELMAIDTQMKVYCLVQRLAARRAGSPVQVDGGRITTMKRVKRTARSVPPYYRSDDLRYNDDVIESTLFRVIGICSDIRDARLGLDMLGPEAEAWRVNNYLSENMRPVPILTDCSWSCPHASGLCAAMDDGSSWPQILTASGKYKQEDPYAYYDENPLTTLRKAMS